MVRRSLIAFRLLTRVAVLVALGIAAGAGCTETSLAFLEKIGGEARDYGLYSYAILIKNNDNDNRSAKFLGDVARSILSTEDTAMPHAQTNVLYIPLTSNNCVNRIMQNEDLEGIDEAEKPLSEIAAYYVRNCYNYRISNSLLSNLCKSPTEEIKATCEGDLSRGPYIFTSAKPASNVSPVPSPFLFIDLSDVHERAFPEFIAAFKAQVKRKDISDRRKIDTLRLRVLSIALTAADWLVPVQKAVADIVASGQTKKAKK